jgi:hypothetical protein
MSWLTKFKLPKNQKPLEEDKELITLAPEDTIEKLEREKEELEIKLADMKAKRSQLDYYIKVKSHQLDGVWAKLTTAKLKQPT